MTHLEMRLQWKLQQEDEEKEDHAKIRRMSTSALGNIGGLLIGLFAFAILVGGYTLLADKKLIRSDYVFYLTIVNVAIFVGIMVAIFYKNDQEITIG